MTTKGSAKGENFLPSLCPFKNLFGLSRLGSATLAIWLGLSHEQEFQMGLRPGLPVGRACVSLSLSVCVSPLTVNKHSKAASIKKN